ncbi:MAG: HD domain-containing protein [Clostridium sp.]|uniref:HD domain-containing protein n=1 Tax=Clostridium sp. TaxID=1506 RepID=UPI003F2BBAA9
MNKINEILKSSTFINNMKKLEELEKDREFCTHGLNHSLDVARIAYIKSLEDNLGFSKDVIYAVALLHDIGRVLQYEKGIPHHEGSVILSKEILKETSYEDEEIELIIGAIENHRNNDELNSFNKFICECDKLSRNCFNCKSYKDCHWDSNKKNDLINY